MSEFSDLPEEQGSPLPLANNDVSNEKLFLDSRHKPYKFFISHEESDFARLAKLIDENGGEVYNDITREDLAKGAEHLNSIIPITSSLAYVDHLRGDIHHFYKPEFIIDSVAQGATLKLTEYIYPDQTEATPIVPSTINDNRAQVQETFVSNDGDLQNEGVKRNTSKHQFSPREDAIIILMARKNPKAVDSKYFFAAVQEKMPNHTVSSIRSRFRSKLKDDVGFYFKAKPNGKLVRDDDGKYVVDKSGSSKGMKSVYTPQDDFYLCNLLSQQRLGPHPNNKDQTIVINYTIRNFFLFMASKRPSHTEQAWRDRYRKFAVKKGILDYKNYYIQATVMGLQPVNLNSFDEIFKNDTQQQYEEFEKLKKEKNEDVPLFVSPEDDQELDNNEEDESEDDVFLSTGESPLSDNENGERQLANDNFNLSSPGQSAEFQANTTLEPTGKRKRLPLKRPILNLSPIPTEEINEQIAVFQQISGTTPRPPKRQRIVPSQYEVVLNDVGVPEKDEPVVFQTSVDDTELERNDKGAAEEDIQQPPLESNTAAPEVANEEDIEDLQDFEEAPESIQQHESIQNISPVTLNTLGKSEFLNRVRSTARESENFEDLVFALERDLGVSQELTTSIIMAVSGDVNTFSEYMRLYLETGENPPVGVPGIWTKEYDDIIWDYGKTRKEDYKLMIKLHNKKRCRHRREFLENLKREQELS